MFNFDLSKTEIFLVIYYLLVLFFFVFIYSAFDYSLPSYRLTSFYIFIITLFIIPAANLVDKRRLRLRKVVFSLVIVFAIYYFLVFLTSCPPKPVSDLVGGLLIKPSISTQGKILKFLNPEWDWLNLCLRADYNLHNILY